MRLFYYPLFAKPSLLTCKHTGREMVDYCENNMEHVHTLCGQNRAFLVLTLAIHAVITRNFMVNAY